MNFKEQLAYDSLQLMKSRLRKGVQSTVKTTTETTRTAVEGPKTIEIAGYKILAMPLESMRLTPEQQKKYEEDGGLINPSRKDAELNKEKMITCTKDFEKLESEIDGTSYVGFELFRKVYEEFPDISRMTEEEARSAGLYPTIYYRNFAARNWMAEMNGGHLATLDNHQKGELYDIYNAAEGTTDNQKHAAIGQALFGGYKPTHKNMLGLGSWVIMGSGSINPNGGVRILTKKQTIGNIDTSYTLQQNSVSSVVVLDK